MIGELAALGAAISWTISAALYGKALQQIKPISANVIRLSFTSVILLMLLVIMGKAGVLASLTVKTIVLAGVSGVIGLGLGDTLYMTSLELLGVARAVPITCAYPLFNILWALLLVSEEVTWHIVLGTVVIVFGIWLLSRERKNNRSSGEHVVSVRGVVTALATAIAWSVSIMMISMAVKETPSLDHALVINTVRVVAIAALLLAFSPIIDRKSDYLKVTRITVVLLIVGGIAALGVGWFFLTYSFMEILESRAIPISSTTPLFSTVVGFALLHEKVTAKNIVGSIVIVAGIFLLFLV